MLISDPVWEEWEYTVQQYTDIRFMLDRNEMIIEKNNNNNCVFIIIFS